MTNLNKLIEYLQKIAEKNYLALILHWEMDTQAPEKSLAFLIDIKTKLNLEVFNLTTNNEYIELLNNVIDSSEFSNLSEEEQIYLQDLKDEYEREKLVPSSFFEEYTKTLSESQNIWRQAKEKNDYNHFKPYLEKVINLTKEYYQYKYPNSTNLYDEMLNTFEKGLTSSKIDKLFEELKQGIIPLIKKLKPSKEKVLPKDNTRDQLLNSAEFLLDYIGFENNRGALGIYPHGYTCKFNNDDVRIAFSNNKSIVDHASTVIHEGGHGIFEQSVGSNLSKYPTYEVDKYALHESQSRFYENMLGRNKNFWLPIYEEFQKITGLSLSLDEFMKEQNNAKPSLIRTQADELTYCLHIIIRYEIERDIFENNINLNELPNIWNQKVKDYLGIEVTSDSEGILQDVHWSQGSFGYFPSYLLGSIFDGMLLNHLNKELGNVDNLLKEGKIKEITNYLQENIHKYGGSYPIDEVAKRVFKEELSSKPLVDYFKSKYE